MSDFSKVSTPSDLVKLNSEHQGDTVQVGKDPEQDLDTALTIIEQLYNWHVKESDNATEEGELSRAKAWAQDAGILFTVYKTLENFEVWPLRKTL